MKLYRITQDISQLYGEYVVSAVVAAVSRDKAVAILIDYCRSEEPTVSPLVIQRKRLTIEYLGGVLGCIVDEVVSCTTARDDDKAPSWSEADNQE